MGMHTEIGGRQVGECSEDFATRKRANEDFFIKSDELQNPDPILRKAGIEIDAYELTAANVRVFAATQSRNAPLLAMEWDILPKTIDDVNLTPPEHIAIIKELFMGYNMRDVLSQISTAFGFGYAVHEMNMCMVGELVLPLEFIAKPQRWFRFNQDNELVFRSRNRTQTIPLPPNKFILTVNNPTFDNPYGENYLGKCFWPAIFRTNGNKWWTIFAEKYGMPWVNASAKDGVKEADIQKMATKIAQMIQDGVIAHEDNWIIELLQAANISGEAYEKYLNNANVDITLAILSTTLTTDIKGGSFAAATVLNEVRKDIVENMQKKAEQTMNSVISLIYELNPWDIQLAPQFVLIPEQKVKLEQSERDKNLVEANPELKLLEKYYTDIYGLKENHFEIVARPERTPPINPEE